MSPIRTLRLTSSDGALARRLFAIMAVVFEEPNQELDGAYLDALLRRADFWALAALEGDEVIGGVTAHALPMTRSPSSELFIYDVAVRADRQRRGVGRRLLEALRAAAAAADITVAFVPADNDDAHALDFYRATGGVPQAVTIFTFSSEE
jgi:aminoglycoside 3-N-acetyltransferase I